MLPARALAMELGDRWSTISPPRRPTHPPSATGCSEGESTILHLDAFPPCVFVFVGKFVDGNVLYVVCCALVTGSLQTRIVLLAESSMLTFSPTASAQSTGPPLHLSHAVSHVD